MSLLTIVSLIKFRKKPAQDTKYIFNITAYLLVVMFSLQIYYIHHSTVLNLIVTLTLSPLIIYKNGNVSKAWECVRRRVFNYKDDYNGF